MSERESCYGCDYFYEKNEMYTAELDGETFLICPDCAEK